MELFAMNREEKEKEHRPGGIGQAKENILRTLCHLVQSNVFRKQRNRFPEVTA